MKSGRIDVDIPSTTTVGKYLVYDLDISIQINDYRIERYKLSKRFSDFVELNKQLNIQGISLYIPSKYSSYYKSNDTVVSERKNGLTKFVLDILTNDKIRTQNNVLNFFNIPKSIFIELTMIEGIKPKIMLKEDSDEKSQNSLYHEKLDSIDSAQQWMEMYKSVKSLLQDVRSKMFNKSVNKDGKDFNVVDLKRNIKSIDEKLQKLQNYLNLNEELGSGEIRRRRELLLSLSKDMNDLKDLLNNMNFTSYERPATNESASSLFKTINSNNSSGRRTFGKAKETQQTRKLDNMGLLQIQKQEMKNQDEEIQGLKDLVIRQKQIGIAVNEELNIQNELLNSLDTQVDDSTVKMKIAKSKVDKFL